MTEKDTVNLLRKLSSGAKMGEEAIKDTLKSAQSPQLRQCLEASREEHAKISQTAAGLLNAYGLKAQSPSPMAAGMSKLKTAMMMAARPEDATVASLIVDGCNMGIKNLSKDLNRLQGASAPAAAAARQLISNEIKLTEQMRKFL